MEKARGCHAGDVGFRPLLKLPSPRHKMHDDLAALDGAGGVTIVATVLAEGRSW